MLKKIFFLFLIWTLMLGAVPALGEAADLGVSPDENKYVILVRDAEDAAPIPGAMVQFCSDIMCMVAVSDADGAAAFEADPGSYTAHILKASAGYEPSQEDVALTAENRTATIALHQTGAAAPARVTFLEKFREKINEAFRSIGK